MIVLLFLLLGIAGLIIGTHLIITGALNIAEHFKLSRLFIGLTILAIGTDLPELVVNINGAIYRLSGIETSGLILGQTIGTGMAQIALTLGFIGLFSTSLFLRKKELIREGSMLIGSVALLFLLGADGQLTRFEGIIFMLVYGVYFIGLYLIEKGKEKEVKRAPHLNKGWAILSLIAGFAILIYCSNIVLNNAVSLAEMFAISQSLIGIAVVGLGTSLPEIILSIGAILKKAPRLSVGNLIGSNIFDILFTLGIGSAISGLALEKKLLFFDIPFLFVTSLIVLLFFIRRKKLTKKESIVLLGIYGIYIVSTVMNVGERVLQYV